MYMYIYIHIHMCVCLCIYVYIQMYTRTHRHTRTHAHIHTYMHTHTHTLSIPEQSAPLRRSHVVAAFVIYTRELKTVDRSKVGAAGSVLFSAASGELFWASLRYVRGTPAIGTSAMLTRSSMR